MSFSYQDFLRWEETDYDSINVKRIYIDIAEDLIAGILLSQIVYWHLPSKRDGNSKLKVKKGNKLWLAKGREDWWDECRITPRQFDRAIGILAEKGIIEKKLFRFNGSPMTHIRLIPDALMEHINDALTKKNTCDAVNWILTKSENPYLQKCEIQLDKSVKTLTYNTTDNTTDILTRASNQKQTARKPFRSIKQESEFDQFWRLYPKKRSKGQAEKTWVKISPDDELYKQILAGLENAKKSIDWQKDGGQYIPYPSTWLNAKGWEDEYKEAKSKNYVN